MKAVKHLTPLVITLILGIVLNVQIGVLPPLGPFMSPFDGFWVNSEKEGFRWEGSLRFEELKDEVKVYYDHRRVPHIFANNLHDLYFIQGYVTARDRLWQMELQTHFAAGRLSEILGDRTLELDRFMRRMGMPRSARQAMQSIESSPDTTMHSFLKAYSNGVNAYIGELGFADLPVEYKLLGYRPEAWTPYKTALLNAYMSYRLTYYEQDIELTHILHKFGRNFLDEWYPDFPDGLYPVIPASKEWPFSAREVDTPANIVSGGYFNRLDTWNDQKQNGSNNWAVSGRRTASGSPILCNDPHLNLSLPSIWYEVQLNAPGMNVYGVSLPGAPFVIIGFNENISWGVTNASRDVKDWYHVRYTNNDRTEYWSDSVKKKITHVIEKFTVRRGPDVVDTIRYTHLGPIVFDQNFHGDTVMHGLALHWMLHYMKDPASTFFRINQAADWKEFQEAMTDHVIPAQNFIFASQKGNIGLWHQGWFPLRWPEQGKFIMEMGRAYEWQDTLQYEGNPHILNPLKQYIYSANQHPTDTSYPYYYKGHFEYFRNRRIESRLSEMRAIRPDDMMRLQTDNYNLQARESLPYMIRYLRPSQLSPRARRYYDEVKNWNHINDPGLAGPAIYEVWYDTLYELTFDELESVDLALTKPGFYIFNRVLRDSLNHPIFDMINTESKETALDICNRAFIDAVNVLEAWKMENQDTLTWGKYKDTRLVHLSRALAPFNIETPGIGGNKHIVNATSKTHGASWRMIVEMSNPIVAYGVYPGGQTGNPGSPYYGQFVKKWEKGEYYRLNFFKVPKKNKDQIEFTQTFTP